ncbi:MAG: TIGR02206 family membrane protein [Saprospiraceae bacterium]|nr:TIGR02206 family membrane protein [Saprospiraceae bacterium]
MPHEHYLIPTYSLMWWGGIILGLGFYSGLAKLGSYFKSIGKEELFRRALFVVFFVREILIHVYYLVTGHFNIQESLPLHLCGLSYLACLVCLYKPQMLLYEYLLMLGSVGALMSFLTPEMTHGYSPFLLFDYYLSHGLILFTPLYLFFVLHIRPRVRSWLYVLVFGNIVLGTVGLINYLIGSNYIYLCEPPKVDNVLITGKFPYHIIGFEVIGSAFVLLIYYIFRRLRFNLFSTGLKNIKWV